MRWGHPFVYCGSINEVRLPCPLRALCARLNTGLHAAADVQDTMHTKRPTLGPVHLWMRQLSKDFGSLTAPRPVKRGLTVRQHAGSESMEPCGPHHFRNIDCP
jgi:hypothetical protein